MENKIQRTFIRQEAYDKLRKWILDGNLAPGAQLRDKELAEQLGVSRTPIREALLRLEDEGLVKTKPNRSKGNRLRVRNPSPSPRAHAITHMSIFSVRQTPSEVLF